MTACRWTRSAKPPSWRRARSSKKTPTTATPPPACCCTPSCARCWAAMCPRPRWRWPMATTFPDSSRRAWTTACSMNACSNTIRKPRIDLPQVFFMRVAMGLALNEVERETRAIEFYEVLSSFDFMSSTPTLFNSGTLRSQLSSCYLTTVPDDLDGIYESIKENALLSKFAGGLGNDWTRVRALGSYIAGTNGESQGVVPF